MQVLPPQPPFYSQSYEPMPAPFSIPNQMQAMPQPMPAQPRQPNLGQPCIQPMQSPPWPQAQPINLAPPANCQLVPAPAAPNMPKGITIEHSAAPQYQPRARTIKPPPHANEQILFKTSFDIELHKLRTLANHYFKWGPRHERQGLILNLRNTMTELLKEYIKFKKSKGKNRLYEIDCLVETMRWLWFEYYEAGYLTKHLKGGRQEAPLKAVARYDQLCKHLTTLGSLVGSKIKELNTNYLSTKV